MCMIGRDSCCTVIPLPTGEGVHDHFAFRQSCGRGMTRRPCDACGGRFVPHPVLGWKGTPMVAEVEITSANSYTRRGDLAKRRFYHPGCFRPKGVSQ